MSTESSGYANLLGGDDVLDLHEKMSEDERLYQLVTELNNSGEGFATKFDELMYRWSGLESLHNLSGVEHIELTPSDKIWILESFSGSLRYKQAIEEAYFNGTDVDFSSARLEEDYIDSQYSALMTRKRTLFLLQSDIMDGLEGIQYFESSDSIIVTDGAAFESSVLEMLNRPNISETDLMLFVDFIKQLEGYIPAMELNNMAEFIEDSYKRELVSLYLNEKFESHVSQESYGGTKKDEFISATNLSDYINAGNGHNVLVGGQGDDTYVISTENIDDAKRESKKDSIYDSSGADTLLFDNDIAKEDIVFSMDGDNLLVLFGDKLQNETLIIDNTIERFKLTDGTIISREKVEEALNVIEEKAISMGITWSPDDVYKNAKTIHDNIELLEVLYLNWENGYKEKDLTERDYEFNRDNEIITGTEGDDIIESKNGEDTLAGGSGNDVLNGGNGNDTYIFKHGDGHDTILDAQNPLSVNITDTGKALPGAGDLQLGDNYSSDIWITEANNAPSDDTLLLNGINENELTAFWKVDDSEINNDLVIKVGATDHYPNRDMNIENIYLYFQNREFTEWVVDEATGSWSKEVFYITKETLSEYSDKALALMAYSLDNGQDYHNYDYQNILKTLEVTQNDAAYNELYQENEDVITIEHYYDERYTIETIKTDNTVLDNDAIMEKMSSENSEMIRGVDWSDNTINAQAGNDVVLGGIQNDSISGGSGSDLINGRKGDDTYFFNLGDGSDQLDDTAIDFNQITEGMLSWYGLGNDITVFQGEMVDFYRQKTVHYGSFEKGFDVFGDVVDPESDAYAGDDTVRFGKNIKIQDIGFAKTRENNGLYIGYGDINRQSKPETNNFVNEAIKFDFSGDIVENGTKESVLDRAQTIRLQLNDGRFEYRDDLQIEQNLYVSYQLDVVADEEYSFTVSNQNMDTNDLIVSVINSNGEELEWQRYENNNGYIRIYGKATTNESIKVLIGGSSEDKEINVRFNGSYAYAVQDIFSYENEIYLNGQFDANTAIEHFELEDGSTISNRELEEGLQEQNNYRQENFEYLDSLEKDGGDARGYVDQLLLEKWHRVNQNIIDDDTANTIIAGDGDDIIKMNGGDDVIYAGYGTDTMIGGSGNDSYHYERWDGHDTIIDSSGVDTVYFGEGITLEDIAASLDTLSGTLELAIIDEVEQRKAEANGQVYHTDVETASQRLTLNEWVSLSGRVESFVFTDGSVLSADELYHHFFSEETGLELSDLLTTNHAPELEESETSLVLQDIRTISGIISASDIDGDALTYTVDVQPSHGSMSIDTDGNWNYQVQDHYLGEDSVTVVIDDGKGGSVVKTFIFDAQVSEPSINTTSVMLAEDERSMNELNVVNPVGGVLTYEVISSADNGIFILDQDGTYSYDPNQDYNGSDAVIVKVTNEYGLSTTSTLTFDIEAVNDTPVTTETEAFVLQDVREQSGQVEASDIDGDTLMYTITTAATHGTVSIDATGAWTYSVDGFYMGTDTAVITVDDGSGGTATQTLTFDARVSPPTLADMTSQLLEDNSANGLLNVINPIGGALAYEVITDVANGTYRVDVNGAWTYDPSQDYSGSDSVTVKVTNEYGLSTISTLTFDIEAVNDVPVTVESELFVLQDVREQTGEIEASDIDGDTLTFSISTQAEHGTLTLDATGAWIYAVDSLYMGTDSAVITVDDGHGGTATKTLTFDSKITSPIVTDHTFNMLEDDAFTSILEVGNPSGAALTYSITKEASVGDVVINAVSGEVTYTPEQDYFGVDSISITVTNEYGLSATSNIVFEVEGVNDAPTVDAMVQDIILTNIRDVDGKVHADDVDGDLLSYTVSEQPEHGLLSVDDEGNWTYEADGSYNGSDSAIIMISDGNGGQVASTLNFTVTGYIYAGEELVISDNGEDTLVMTDVNKNELEFLRSDDDLTILVEGRGSIVLKEYFIQEESGVKEIITAQGNINLQKDVIKDAQVCWWHGKSEGTSDSKNLLIGSVYSDLLIGSNESDILFGESANDMLSARIGDDLLVGGDGNDRLFGGDGEDSLYGDNGCDALYGGDGNDGLIGGLGNDLLEGEAGNDFLWGGDGHDILKAGDNDDFLSGGSGYDILKGEGGNDTYFFEKGDQDAIIIDQKGRNHFGFCSYDAGLDTVKFGEGITKEDISFEMRFGNLYLQFGESDTVEINSQNKSNNKIERFELSNGSFLTDEDVEMVVQQLNAYACDKGMWSYDNDTIRNNEEMMNIVSSAWQSA